MCIMENAQWTCRYNIVFAGVGRGEGGGGLVDEGEGGGGWRRERRGEV